MENEVGKKQTFAIFLVVFIIALLIGFGIGFLLFYTGGSNDNKNTNEDTNTNAVVDNTNTNTVEENENQELTYNFVTKLISIAQLDNNPRKSSGSTPLLTKNGMIKDFDNYSKEILVYLYAYRNNMTTTSTSDIDPDCNAGSYGKCTYISADNFNKVAKLYGIEGYIPKNALFQERNNKYYSSYNGDISAYSDTEHDISYVVRNQDVVLIDNLTSYKVEGGVEKETREFTFKKLEDGTYYLYSVYAK